MLGVPRLLGRHDQVFHHGRVLRLINRGRTTHGGHGTSGAQWVEDDFVARHGGVAARGDGFANPRDHPVPATLDVTNGVIDLDGLGHQATIGIDFQHDDRTATGRQLVGILTNLDDFLVSELLADSTFKRQIQHDLLIGRIHGVRAVVRRSGAIGEHWVLGLSRATRAHRRNARHVTNHDELPAKITLQHEVLTVWLAGLGFQPLNTTGVGAVDTLLEDSHLDTRGHVDHGAATIGQLEADVLSETGGREEGNGKDGKGKFVVHAVAFVCFKSDQLD